MTVVQNTLCHTYQLAADQVIFSGGVIEKVLQIRIVKAIVCCDVVWMPFLVKLRLTVLSGCTTKHFLF